MDLPQPNRSAGPSGIEPHSVINLLRIGEENGDWSYVEEVLAAMPRLRLWATATSEFRGLVLEFHEKLRSAKAYEAIHGTDSLFRADNPQAVNFRAWGIRAKELARKWKPTSCEYCSAEVVPPQQLVHPQYRA